MYSFGLLCLWLLFGAKTEVDMAPPAELLGPFERPLNFDVYRNQQTTLEIWKKAKDDVFMKWIEWLIKEHIGVDNELKDRLLQFFKQTLAFCPQSGTNDYYLLLQLLCPAL